FELREVEARTQRYPYLEAFLALLGALCAWPLPPTLGEGTRLPGVHPYLAFVLDDALLPALERRYAEPAALWRIVAAALLPLRRLLYGYSEQQARDDLQ